MLPWPSIQLVRLRDSISCCCSSKKRDVMCRDVMCYVLLFISHSDIDNALQEKNRTWIQSEYCTTGRWVNEARLLLLLCRVWHNAIQCWRGGRHANKQHSLNAWLHGLLRGRASSGFDLRRTSKNSRTPNRGNDNRFQLNCEQLWNDWG